MAFEQNEVSQRTNNTLFKVPTLAQQMTTISKNLVVINKFKIWETLTGLQSWRHLAVNNLVDTYRCTIW